jgi:hypothetical protein
MQRCPSRGCAAAGEPFLCVHWVAVPETLRARRVNRRGKFSAPRPAAPVTMRSAQLQQPTAGAAGDERRRAWDPCVIAAGAAAAASSLSAVVTEIYLCGMCSCQETLRRNSRR